MNQLDQARDIEVNADKLLSCLVQEKKDGS